MELHAYGKTFTLANDDKVRRAIEGSVSAKGQLKGGVGENAAPEALLVEYDRLAGLIKLNGDRVKTGSFYNVKTAKAHEEPQVKLQFRINGKQVDIDADEPLPPQVRAAKMADETIDFSKMTSKQLKDYADARGIDTSEATTKAQLIKAIAQVEEGTEEEGAE